MLEKREQQEKTRIPERDEKGRLLPGSTANPNGRPKKKTFRDYFNEEEEKDLIARIKKEIKEGKKTDITKMAIEQIFGKPRQPVTGGDEDDSPLVVKIIRNDRDNDSI